MGVLIAIVTLIVILFIISILTFVHELGHYYVAKKSNVRVIEFAIGLGPAVYQKKVNGTTYSFRALPFGGYVSVLSEDVKNEIEELQGKYLTQEQVTSLEHKLVSIKLNEKLDDQIVLEEVKPLSKIWFAFAGIFMNILFLFITVMLQLSIVGKQVLVEVDTTPTITCETNYNINNETKYFNEIDSNFYSMESESTIKLEESPDEYLYIMYYEKEYGFDLIVDSFKETGDILFKSILFIANIFTFGLLSDEIYGGAGYTLVDSNDIDFRTTNLQDYTYNFFEYFIFFSGLMIIFNILPILPLDGGKMTQYTYEAISKKRLSKKLEENLIKAGWIFILVITFGILFVPFL